MSSDQSFLLNGLTDAQQQLTNFWSKTMDDIKNMKPNDFKTQELPLARIKKIMKMDEDVKMISAEAPVLFAKAAEIFINELTLRAWVHAEDNKRRTLQRNDIAMAITKYDQFDFLIDIVPREEIRPAKRADEGNMRTVVTTDQVQYYFQLAQQQQQQAVQQGSVTLTTGQPQIQLQSGPLLQQQLQLLTGGASGPVATMLSQPTVDNQQQQQIIQVQSPATAASAPQMQTMQVFTQVMGPNGEMQQIPIQLTQSQLQAIALQMQGKQPGQPIVIHTAASVDQSGGASDSSSQHPQFTTQPLFQLPLFGQTSVHSDADQASGD